MGRDTTVLGWEHWLLWNTSNLFAWNNFIPSSPALKITDASKREYAIRRCDSLELFQEIASVSEMKNPCKVNQLLLGGQQGAVLCQPICSVVPGDAIMHWQTRFNHKDLYKKNPPHWKKKKENKQENPNRHTIIKNNNNKITIISELQQIFWGIFSLEI